jgi:hypothetical protein
MAPRRLGPVGLTAPVAGRYVRARRAAGYRLFRSEKALTPLLGYLRRLGAAPEMVTSPAQTPAERHLRSYRDYLMQRDMVSGSVRGYLDLVGPFVEHHAGDGAGLRGLTAGEVTSFLVAESRRLSPKTVQRLASGLRSLLRYWHVRGVIDAPLAAAVPKVAHRARTCLAGCDRRMWSRC